MRVFKSMLLGAAASFVAVSAASAADLAPKPAPAVAVEYVKVCSQFGAGYTAYFIPGTDTCLRVGGYVRNEWYSAGYDGVPFGLVADMPRGEALSYAHVRAALILDARTKTEYGTLRSFTEIRYNLYSGAGARIALQKAYIQFAGFTAGRTQSMFDFYANSNVLGSDPATIGSDTHTTLLAYTAEFGSGWSVTLSLEDGTIRRSGLDGFGEAGHAMPDVVANVRVEQSWGTAQLSGAVHQLRSRIAADDTEYGFAIQGGVTLNLPMIADGDTFTLQAAYAQGAMSYLGVGNICGGAAANTCFISGFDGSNAFVTGIDQSTGWAVVGEFLHYWRPNLRSAIFAGYLDVEYGDFGVDFGGGLFLEKQTAFSVGANLIWTPVKNLDIGIQVDYTRVDNDFVNFAPIVPVRFDESIDAWRGVLSIQRSF